MIHCFLRSVQWSLTNIFRLSKNPLNVRVMISTTQGRTGGSRNVGKGLE
jgi:hypothetical protein